MHWVQKQELIGDYFAILPRKEVDSWKTYIKKQRHCEKSEAIQKKLNDIHLDAQSFFLRLSTSITVNTIQTSLHVKSFNAKACLQIISRL